MSENINNPKEEVKAAEPVVEAPAEVVAEKVAEAPVVEAPVAAPVAEEKPKAKKEPKAEETVSVISKGTLFWDGVGRLVPGVNVVSKADSEKWLTLKNVSLAPTQK